MSYGGLLAAIAPVVALLALGWGVRRVGWLSREADQTLLALVVRLFYPSLIFDAVVGNERAREAVNLVVAPLAGVAAVVVGFAVAGIVARIGLPADARRRRTFIFTTGLFNYGYIPVPLIQAFFGRDTLAVLFLFNLGVELAIWTIGLMVLTGGTGTAGWKRILNPSVVALLAAVGLNLSGLPDHLPGAFLETIRLLGACSIPLGLMLIGATVADEVDAGQVQGGARDLAWAAPVRLGLLPLVFIGAALAPGLEPELRQVLVIQAAMPCAIFPIVLARHYGGAVTTALWVVVGTTVIGIILLPWWIRVGFQWTGLVWPG